MMRVTVALMLSFILVGPSIAYTSAAKYLDKPAEWYTGDDAKRMADNILTFQTKEGSWPKNVETAEKPYEGDKSKLEGTFDNGATTIEMYYLAKVAHATHEAKYEQAFIKALDLILKGQYANGGWPQSFPIHQGSEGYDHYITFNDGAMARLMFLLRDVFTSDVYNFVSDDTKQACRKAFDKGVDCILKCQIKVNGKLTAWCAQHDDKTLEPRPARKFEPVSISGCESVGILHVLMSIEKPSPDVINAIDSAVAWLDSVKIPGIRVVDTPDSERPKDIKREVVKDPSAPPMWARFYEIGTNRPIFSDRDSVIKYDLMEIGDERRNGYQWLKYWPKNLLEKEYPEWKKKHSETASSMPTSK